MAINKRKSALILSGGGITGAMYEIGCLAAFDDYFEGTFSVRDFDMYVGTSAGAIVASLIANGIFPREIYDAIRTNRDCPLNFTPNDIYCPCTREAWNFFGRALKGLPGVARYYFNNRKHMRPSQVLHLLAEKMPPGIFRMDNLETTLQKIFTAYNGTNDFRSLEKELYITATDIDSGRRVVFGDEGWDRVPISKAVAASAAIPVLIEPVHIEGRDYVDGSVANVAHLDVGIDHGADFLFIINPITHVINDGRKVCFVTHDGRCGLMREMGVTFIAAQANRIERHDRMEMALKRFRGEHPEVEMHVLEANLDEGFMFSHGHMSYATRTEVLEHAYQSATKKLPMLRDKIPAPMKVVNEDNSTID
jgi:predicted acylesterase/phospholipase RssA